MGSTSSSRTGLSPAPPELRELLPHQQRRLALDGEATERALPEHHPALGRHGQRATAGMDAQARRVLVAQQQAGGVGLEQRRGPLHQLGGEAAHLQVRERRIGEDLKRAHGARHRLGLGAGPGLAHALSPLAAELDEHRHLGAQDLGLEGLDHVVHGARGVGQGDLLHLRDLGGEEDDRDVARARTGADDARGLQAVEPGHADVEEDDRDVLAQQRPQRLLAGLGADQSLAQRLQDRPQRRQVLLVVVDQQDAHRVLLRRWDRRRGRDEGRLGIGVR